MPDVLTGQIIGGRFKIQEVIGEGGMGKVYKGININLNQFVAIKVLKSEFAKDEKMKARFKREVRSTSRVQHKNVVSLYESGQLVDGNLYLIMEYIDGRSIDQILDDEGALPVARVIYIMIQIADALSIAHNFGIMHRDLKPENIIIIDDNGKDLVKVLDFGLAKMVESDDPANKITMAGEIFGSPVYMSPEQCLGGKTDIRTDIYSLGAIGFELLTGEPLFDAPNIVTLMLAHKNEIPRTPSKIYPENNIPQELDNLILKCLSKNPEDRYASGADLAVELRKIQDLIITRNSGAPADLKISKKYQSANYMSVGTGQSLTPSTIKSLIQQRLREKLYNFVEILRNQNLLGPQLSKQISEISQLESELSVIHNEKDKISIRYLDMEAQQQQQIGQLRIAIQDLTFDYELLYKYVIQNPNIAIHELKQRFSYLDETSAPYYGKDLLEDVNYQIRSLENRIGEINAEIQKLAISRDMNLSQIIEKIEQKENTLKSKVFFVVKQLLEYNYTKYENHPYLKVELNNLSIFYKEALTSN